MFGRQPISTILWHRTEGGWTSPDTVVVGGLLLCRRIGSLIPSASGNGPMPGGTGRAMNLGHGLVITTGNGSWTRSTAGCGCLERNGLPRGSFGEKLPITLGGRRVGGVGCAWRDGRRSRSMCTVFHTV